jgi:hypothetical protein
VLCFSDHDLSLACPLTTEPGFTTMMRAPVQAAIFKLETLTDAAAAK